MFINLITKIFDIQALSNKDSESTYIKNRKISENMNNLDKNRQNFVKDETLQSNYNYKNTEQQFKEQRKAEFSQNEENKIIENSDNLIVKNDLLKYKNLNNENKIENPIIIVLEKLKSNLKTFGRKSLLSLIKHFKYYDNGTKFINRYDFTKVIKDFRLNLTTNEIEKLFDYYLTDKKKMLINYEVFINVICAPLNETRKNLLLEIFENLISIGRDSKNIEIELLKEVYNPQNNIFGRDADEVYYEYINCIELYHNSYKGKRNNLISLEEFLEFYRFIGFLVDKDEDFQVLIDNEFIKINEFKIKNSSVKIKKIQENSNINNEKKNLTKEENIGVSMENDNISYHSVENYTKKKWDSINQGVSEDIIKDKIENYNCQNIIDHNLQSEKNKNEININKHYRNNKFTKELKEKSDDNLLNYVISNEFKRSAHTPNSIQYQDNISKRNFNCFFR